MNLRTLAAIHDGSAPTTFVPFSSAKFGQPVWEAMASICPTCLPGKIWYTFSDDICDGHRPIESVKNASGIKYTVVPEKGRLTGLKYSI